MLLIALLATASVFPYLVGPTRLVLPDAYHYADLGRQVARGEGFTSLITYPYVIAWMHDAGISVAPPWPNVARFPLIALVYAPFFLVLGASDWTVALLGVLFHVLAACTTFLLGARLFNVRVGIVAASIFAINVSDVANASAGLLDLPAGLCLLVATVLLDSILDAGRDGASARARPLVLGGLLGLSFLLRYDLVVMAVAGVLVLAVGRGGAGRRQAVWMLLGAAVAPGLWMLHNLYAAGSPFLFLGFDRNVLRNAGAADPYADVAYRNVWTVLRDHPEILAAKVPQLLWPFVNLHQLFGWGFAWLGPAFLAATVVLCLGKHRAARPATFVLVVFVLRAVILGLTHHERRFYDSYVPLLLVYVVGVAWMLVAAACARRPRLETGLAAVLVASYLAFQALLVSQAAGRSAHGVGGIPGSFHPVRLISPLLERLRLPDAKRQEAYRAIRRRTPVRTVFATFKPEPVAWYGERPAIALDAASLTAVEGLGLRIDGLVYPTRMSGAVERSLRRQGVHGEFVKTLIDGDLTVWLRQPLIARWREPERERPGPE